MIEDDEVALLWPDRPTCHDHDPYAQHFKPVSWRPAGMRLHPDNDHVPAFRTCSHCGSIHPEDLYCALLAGAKLGGSDWKYGWPHKFYVDGIPNSNKGNLITVMGGSGPLKGGFSSLEDQRARYNDNPNYRLVSLQGEGIDSWEWHGQDGSVVNLWVDGDHYEVKVRRPDGPTTHGKWYNTHLLDLNDMAFSAMAEVLMKHTNIQFYKKDGKLHYMAPRPGYQKA